MNENRMNCYWRKITMDKNRMNCYWQLIQKLLDCPNEEEWQILNAHSDLLDPGLLGMIIADANQNCIYSTAKSTSVVFLPGDLKT